MRKKLASEEGVRKKFKATFSRIGKRVNFNGYSEDTILLTNISDASTGETLCDHLWFAFSKAFEKPGLQPGMEITFDARIKTYRKGYVNPSLGVTRKSKDWKLSHPTNVVIITS